MLIGQKKSQSTLLYFLVKDNLNHSKASSISFPLVRLIRLKY